MTNRKTTKRALLMSVLSMFLCLTMLVGTTFAWFTDEVESAKNQIIAGNLDVELYNGLDKSAKTVTASTELFEIKLWEPGAVVFENLTVANNGTLALKYALSVNIEQLQGEVNLADALKVAVVADGISDTIAEDREAVLAAAAGKWQDFKSFEETGKLYPETYTPAEGEEGPFDQTKTYGIVIWWEPTDEDNKFNMKDGAKQLQLSIGVNLFATQLEAELDSFGNDYDADATLPELKDNATDLAAALTANEKEIAVTLASDIDLPISSLGAQTPGSGEYKLGGADTESIVIDLNGHKLNITTTYWSGIGAVNPDATIVIKNGTMTSSQATGTWNSYDVTFANCNYEFENVVFDKAIAFTNSGKAVSMSNVTINETHDYYALWIAAKGQTVEIDGLTINSDGRAIKIDEQYVDAPAKVTLNVSNANIKSAKKAAIVVKSVAGADVTVNNVNIANTVDPVHAVWVDEDAAAYANLVTVNGGEKANEAEVAISRTDLQSKLDKAADGAYIEVVNDIVGNVTATQKAGVKVTVEGNNKTFAGVLLVDGKSATYTTAGLTIKNFNFVADSISADACIQLGNGTNATRYTCNVTVEGCTFDVPGAVGVKSYTGGDKNLTITGCTATANAHSLAQLKGIDGVLVENCEVYACRGINFNNSNNVSVVGCTIDVEKYAVRFGESANDVKEVYAITDSVLTSDNVEDDAVVVLRAGATNATLTLTNTELNGTITMTGHENADIIVK